MRILIVESSPHKHSSSDLLAEQFIEGAKRQGTRLRCLTLPGRTFNPCLGCDTCGMAGPCVQKDDMTKLRELLLQMDMAVFVASLYYG